MKAVHLVAGAVFAGGLAFLGVSAGVAKATLDESTRIEFFRRMGRRFAVLGGAALALLVATGTYMAARRLDTLSDLTATDWGKTLAAKLGLVAIVVVLTVVHGAVQGPTVRRLREQAIEEPGDEGLAARVHRAQARSGAVQALLLAVTLAILVLAARL